jgi:hypothetical protein
MIENVPVFLGLTCVLLGGCAILAGQAVAAGWRPWPQVLLYALLLGLFDRFLAYALFKEHLLSPAPFATDTVVLLVLALLSHRRVRVRKMVTQYPWLYERSGWLNWREKQGSAE